MSIPSVYRMELERRSQHAPILTRAFECLRLYAYDDWCEEERQISACNASSIALANM